MSETSPSMITCPRCGKPQPAKMLVGGLCAQCVARSVQVDFLASTDAELEEKEPLSLNVQGYEVIELIGGGGMGEVYRAVMVARAREVAMKVVAGRLTRDPETTARFEAEVAALSQLDHPNVVRVLDHGEMPNGRHFLVMEYVDGCDLRRLLRVQRLEPERAIDIFLKVCAGVQHAHHRGLVHRDIKPANILIGLDDTVKVADFGLAKALVEESFAYGFTQTRDTFGTPYYVAPEVTQKAQSADARADVYALGVLLYELLSGAVPMGQFTPLSKRTGLDKRLDAVVARALIDDPSGRTGSVKELAESVESIWRDHISVAERKARHHRLLVLVAILVVLCIGAAAGSLFTQHRQTLPMRSFPPPSAATKEKPWANSLGMKFVPLPATKILCSIWETRVADFTEFFKADNAVMPDWRSGANDPRNLFRKNQRRPKLEMLMELGIEVPEGDPPTWRNPGPGFKQTPNHPVCGIELIDARLFCAWLTWKERIEKRITSAQAYRLPKDEEWSLAAMLSLEKDLPPSELDMALLDVVALQSQGNFGGQELLDTAWPDSLKPLRGRDPFTRTAPVGSFAPNALGIYDLAGNVSEWTDTEVEMPSTAPFRRQYYMRGGCWGTVVIRGLLLEARQIEALGRAKPSMGFRVVLDLNVPEARPRGLQEEDSEMVEKKSTTSGEN